MGTRYGAHCPGMERACLPEDGIKRVTGCPRLPGPMPLLLELVKLVLWSLPVNVLLPVVPLGLLLGFLGASAQWVFWANFFGIVPLASVLAFATEELAEHVGETLGGLLNATFGNAVELIVLAVALLQGQVRIVQASMLGLILLNLLLVLGCCFVAGGYNRVQQKFNQTAAQTMSSLMGLATVLLLIPAAFHAALPPYEEKDPSFGTPYEFPGGSSRDQKILGLSRGTAVLLLLLYVLFLVFQLKTHKLIFDAVQEESAAVELGADEPENEALHLTVTGALATLMLTTVVVSFSADFLVGSIDDFVERTLLLKTFIGLIVIPIVGNAAEHVTAVVVSTKNKMDLALGVAIGLLLQIALFCTPFMVLVGWVADVPMSLFFSTFETVVMFSLVFITLLVVLDGESNWLEGAMLLITYLIIAIAFFYYP